MLLAGSSEADFALHDQGFYKYYVFNTLFLQNEHGDPQSF